MDSLNSSFKSQPTYPKEKSFTNKKRKRQTKNNNDINNPLINHFNVDSFFIYDQIDHIRYFKSLKNKNLIKLTFEELNSLNSICDSIKVQKDLINNSNYVQIDKNTLEKINNYWKTTRIKTPLISYLEEKIKQNPHRMNFSCRKLANEYYQDTGMKIGKTTINNILKKNFGLHFLKTTIKNKSLNDEIGIISCLCFIKIFVKCLKFEFTPIFIDESKIELSNNHYSCWRFKNEEINFGNSQKLKSNLLLAVGPNQIYHFEIKNENSTSDDFLNFLKDLREKLKKDTKKKFVYILDNCSIHKTQNIISYLKEEKINTIFTAPYKSDFNCVELSFRAIKRITYQNIYDSIEKANLDVAIFLNNEKINATLLYNYGETISQYISYSESKSDINLNNFVIE